MNLFFITKILLRAVNEVCAGYTYTVPTAILHMTTCELLYLIFGKKNMIVWYPVDENDTSKSTEKYHCVYNSSVRLSLMCTLFMKL